MHKRGVEIDKKKSGQKLKNASHTDGQQRRPSKADSGSFICKSPPQARDCPMKEKLAGCRGQEGRTPKVNPLQLRKAITHEKPTSAGLMYVEIVLNEMATPLVRWSIPAPRDEATSIQGKSKVPVSKP